MKNFVGILFLALLVSSCSLFKKPSMTQEEIDAMVAENTTLKAQSSENKEMEDQIALVRMQLDEAMLKLADCENAAKSKAHIIVGAFKNSSYADDYSNTIKGAGYEGKVIAGPYNFSLVTASSHESLQAAINSLGQIRENVVETAWIYLQ